MTKWTDHVYAGYVGGMCCALCGKCIDLQTYIQGTEQGPCPEIRHAKAIQGRQNPNKGV